MTVSRPVGFIVAFRLLFAALSLAGVITQLIIAINIDFSIVSFFSYFTNLANLIASIVFIVSAARLARGRPSTDLDVAIRGASVVYMAFVGIVFNTLLRGADLGDLKPWVNTVHHLVMPVAVVLDWLLWPPRSRISIRTTLLWMIFPAVYVIYSLVRGAATGFYAYPFFNPGVNGGYGGVAAYCIVMLVAFVGLAFLVRIAGFPRRSVDSV